EDGIRDFHVTGVQTCALPILVEKERSIPAGSGQKLTFKVARSDGFEGPVRVNISGLPAGFVASAPVVIEGGHETATIVLNAAAESGRAACRESRQVAVGGGAR